MATLPAWRKAYGALKDTTKVGIAKVNSDFKDLDVAIVKATNHVESPPKERYIRKIFAATSVVRPRADVVYCIHALARRLTKTCNWVVALKTLIVIHRTLRDGDLTFREELLNFSQRGRILQISNFKDDSSPIAWDCSAWVRAYALFLEEKLECFRVLKYDVEAERLTRPSQGNEKGYSRTRDLESEELLEQLPTLQQLIFRLIGCKPEGAAVGNYLIQCALALVLKESFKVYCAVNDGIINLVDKFFDMPRHEALKSLEIYRKASQQAGSLSEFYEVCKGLELARNFQFPVLREPPKSFLSTMEEYVREAPRIVSVPRDTLEFPERLLLTYKPEEAAASLSPRAEEDVAFVAESTETLSSEPLTSSLPTSSDVGDLLGLGSVVSTGAEIEDRNALALAVVPSDGTQLHDSQSVQGNEFDPSGWELALVSTPSTSTATESQLAGGLDNLTLSSLYDEAAYRSMQPKYGIGAANPFEVQDPFALSSSSAAPPVIQVASAHLQVASAHLKAQSSLLQSNPFIQPSDAVLNTNPFAESAAFDPFSMTPHQTNPFQSTGLM